MLIKKNKGIMILRHIIFVILKHTKHRHNDTKHKGIMILRHVILRHKDIKDPHQPSSLSSSLSFAASFSLSLSLSLECKVAGSMKGGGS